MQRSSQLLLIVVESMASGLVKTRPDAILQLARERTNYKFLDGDKPSRCHIQVSNIGDAPSYDVELPRDLHNCLRDVIQSYAPGGRRPSYLSELSFNDAPQSRFGFPLSTALKAPKIGHMLKTVLATGVYLAADTNFTLSNYSWLDQIEDWFIKTIRSRSLSTLTKDVVEDADSLSKPYLRQVLFPLVDNMCSIGWDMDQFSSKFEAPELIQRLIRRTEEPSVSARTATYDSLKKMYMDDLTRWAAILIRQDTASYRRLHDLMHSYGVNLKQDPADFTRKSRCAPPELRYAVTRDVATLIALRRLLRNGNSIRDNGYLPTDASLRNVNEYIKMSFCQTFDDVIPKIRRGDFTIENHPFVGDLAAEAMDVFSHVSSDDESMKKSPALSLAVKEVVDSPQLIGPLMYTYFIADYFRAYSVIYDHVWRLTCVGSSAKSELN